MTRLLQRLGGWCATHPVLVIGGWVVAAAVTAALAATVGGAYAQGSTLPGTEVQAAQSRLSARFPAAADTSDDVLLHGSSPGVVAAAVPRVRAGVVGLPHVVASSVAVAARSADGRTLLVHVRYDVPRFTLHTRDLRVLQAVARSGGVTGYVTGELFYELNLPGNSLAEKVGVGLAVLVLLIAFGSAVATLMPVASAALAIVTGLSLVKLLALVYAVNDTAPS